MGYGDRTGTFCGTPEFLAPEVKCAESTTEITSLFRCWQRPLTHELLTGGALECSSLRCLLESPPSLVMTRRRWLSENSSMHPIIFLYIRCLTQLSMMKCATQDSSPWRPLQSWEGWVYFQHWFCCWSCWFLATLPILKKSPLTDLVLNYLWCSVVAEEPRTPTRRQWTWCWGCQKASLLQVDFCHFDMNCKISNPLGNRLKYQLFLSNMSWEISIF